MNKEEALKAIYGGSKITHKNFTPEEWMKLSGSLYEFEDGCLCEFDEFWRWRDDESWLDGWRIFDE